MRQKILCILVVCIMFVFGTVSVSASEMPTETNSVSNIIYTPKQTREDAAAEANAYTLPQLYQYYLTFNDNTLSNVAIEYINLYNGDEVFLNHFARNPADAIGMVKKVIDSAYLHAVGRYTTTRAAVGVPNIRQKEDDYCGPCSTLQIIVQQGYSSSVTGSTYGDKQDTLARNMGLSNLPDGPSADALSALINQYCDTSAFSYIPVDTYSTFKTNIQTSIDNGAGAILRTNPSHLSYYPSTATIGHYIAVDNITSTYLYLKDCHYSDDYFGSHTELITNCFNATNGKHIVGKF